MVPLIDLLVKTHSPGGALSLMLRHTTGTLNLQVALPFLHEHELPEAVRFEMQQAEEAQKASGAPHDSISPHSSHKAHGVQRLAGLDVWCSALENAPLPAAC